jgi:hypothetical protein
VVFKKHLMPANTPLVTLVTIIRTVETFFSMLEKSKSIGNQILTIYLSHRPERYETQLAASRV